MSRGKTGMILFYNYLDNEFKELSYEQVGKIVLGLLYHDSCRGIPASIQEDIQKETITRILFNVLIDKTDRATQKWHETDERFKKARNKNNTDTDDEDIYDDEE